VEFFDILLNVYRKAATEVPQIKKMKIIHKQVSTTEDTKLLNSSSTTKNKPGNQASEKMTNPYVLCFCCRKQKLPPPPLMLENFAFLSI
jgi:hypothetical protein